MDYPIRILLTFALLLSSLISAGWMITSLENCWVWGICGNEGVRGRGFGEVYKALDKGSGMYVAVKKAKLFANEKELLSESKLLM